MKKMVLLLGLLIFFIQSETYAQLDQKKVLYLRKIEGYKRMRNTGLIMGGAGLVTGIVGVAIVTQETDNYYSSTRFFNEERYLTGISCIVAAVPLTTAGTIFGLIGTHKVRKYKEKLNRLSLNVNYSPSRKGLAFKYTF